MPGDAENAGAKLPEKAVMRQELDILQQVYAEWMEQLTITSAALTTYVASGEAFWSWFNDMVLDPDEREMRLRAFLEQYVGREHDEYYTLFVALRQEYLYHLAVLHCAGLPTETSKRLLLVGYAPFTKEVAMYRLMEKALVAEGRRLLKEKLDSRDDWELSDTEICRAATIVADGENRIALKEQLQQWQAEDDQQQTPHRKKRWVWPLLLLRLAAAAAVGTMAVVGVQKWRHNNDAHWANTPALHTPTTKPSTSPGIDTALVDSVAIPNHTQPSGADERAVATMPDVWLAGHAAEKDKTDTLTNVTIVLTTAGGAVQKIESADGTFMFHLPVNKDFVLSGVCAGYTSAQVSLCTRGLKRGSKNDTIAAVLRFIKN